MANKEIQVNITADVSDLNKKVDSAKGKVEEIGTTGSQSGSMLDSIFSELGKTIAAAFSVAAVVNFAKEVAEVGKNFEYNMAKVQATSGASAAELEKLEERARELAKTTMYSSSDTAEALNYMALAGWDATQMMDGLAGVLNLATAGAMDLGSASDIVTDVLTMFGMKAEEAGRMVDVMATTQSRSNTTVEMLGDALKYAGGTAYTFGLDIEQTSAALGIMANAGIKSSMAGRSLKNILARLAAPTKEVSEGIATLGVEITNADGSMRDLDDILVDMKGSMQGLTEAQKVQVAKQIAGTEAMSGFLALVNGADTDLQKLQEQLYNSAGAGQNMADIMSDTLKGSIDNLSSSWEELKLQLFDLSGNAMKGVVDSAINIVDYFTRLKETGLEFNKGFKFNISDATQVAISGFKDTYRELGVLTESLRYTSDAVTPEFAQNMAIAMENWSTETTALIQKTYDEDLAILNKYFADAQITDENEKAAMVERLDSHYNVITKDTEESNARINEIIQTALEEGRKITIEEQEEIERLRAESNERILSMAAQSADEELALLEALAIDKDRITKESAEQVYAQAVDQKEKVIGEAQKLRDEEIKQAYRLQQAGIITEEEYSKMVTTAQEKYGDIATEADSKFSDIVTMVSASAKELGYKFDTETGKVKRKWYDFLFDVSGKSAKFDSQFTHTTVLKERDERTITKGLFSFFGLGKSRDGGTPVASGYSSITPMDARTGAFDSTTYNNSQTTNGVNISVGNMTVRNDSDINRIAEQLYKMQQRNSRGKGVLGNVY